MKCFVQSRAARKQKSWDLNLVIWAPESLVFFFFFFFYFFVSLFLAVLDLCCCLSAFSSCSK